MEYVLDSVWGKNGLQNLGSFMNIANIVFPSSVEPDNPFAISYTATNAAATELTAYGLMLDAGLNQVPGSYWEAVILAGGDNSVVISFPNGISQNFSGEIQVGHFEEGCTENSTKCVDGYVNVCVNNTWSPTTESCTPPTTAGGWIMLAGFGGILVLGLLMGRKKGEKQ